MNTSFNITHFDITPGIPEIVEIVYQMAFFIIGTPVNLIALWRQYRVQKRMGGTGTECRLVKLSLHLIIANLMVVCIYCLWRTYWFLNVVWKDGDILCRIFSFICAFPFHLWSNLVTAIALDMLCCVRSPLSSYRSGGHRVKFLIIGAWLWAFVCSFPMVIFKGTIKIPGTHYYQCYSLLNHFQGLLFNTFHIVTVFYFPLVIIVVCYSMIGLSLKKQMIERRLLVMRPDPPITRHDPTTFSRLSSFQSISSRRPSNCNELEINYSEDRRSSIAGRSMVSASALLRRQSKHTRTKHRFLRVSVAIIATFVLSWLPYQIMAVLRIVCEPFSKCSEFSLKMNWTQAALIASACINPFLYRFKARSTVLRWDASSFLKESSTATFGSLKRKVTLNSMGSRPRPKQSLVVLGAPSELCQTLHEESEERTRSPTLSNL